MVCRELEANVNRSVTTVEKPKLTISLRFGEFNKLVQRGSKKIFPALIARILIVIMHI
jgi:hypothetical protein